MADRTIGWIRDQKAQAPDKPFFIHDFPGVSHAPHHVPEPWADRYKGPFDQGGDRLCEETFTRQKKLGVIPADAELTPPTGGRDRLVINNRPAGESQLAHTVPLRFSSYAGMDLSRDNGDVDSATCKARAPFAFSGALHRVVFDLANRPG